jgi:hypothetical protein
VYTCLFGYSEEFLNQTYEDSDSIDFLLFTDNPDITSDFWRTVYVQPNLLDPARQSKGFKHRPHYFLSEYESSLYIDNTVMLLQKPDQLFRHFKSCRKSIMLFQHPNRNCVFEESRVVVQFGFDDASTVESQMNHYRQNLYPQNNGLHATTLILRNHNDLKLNNAMDDWHNQVLRYSKRDQLSFDVIRFFHNLDVETIKQDLYENALMKWPVIRDGKRIPRDFIAHTYLKLNPDVLAAGVNPYKHFFDFGISEGREYRDQF